MASGQLSLGLVLCLILLTPLPPFAQPGPVRISNSTLVQTESSESGEDGSGISIQTNKGAVTDSLKSDASSKQSSGGGEEFGSSNPELSLEDATTMESGTDPGVSPTSSTEPISESTTSVSTDSKSRRQDPWLILTDEQTGGSSEAKQQDLSFPPSTNDPHLDLVGIFVQTFVIPPPINDSSFGSNETSEEVMSLNNEARIDGAAKPKSNQGDHRNRRDTDIILLHDQNPPAVLVIEEEYLSTSTQESNDESTTDGSNETSTEISDIGSEGPHSVVRRNAMGGTSGPKNENGEDALAGTPSPSPVTPHHRSTGEAVPNTSFLEQFLQDLALDSQSREAASHPRGDEVPTPITESQPDSLGPMLPQPLSSKSSRRIPQTQFMGPSGSLIPDSFEETPSDEERAEFPELTAVQPRPQTPILFLLLISPAKSYPANMSGSTSNKTSDSNEGEASEEILSRRKRDALMTTPLPPLLPSTPLPTSNPSKSSAAVTSQVANDRNIPHCMVSPMVSGQGSNENSNVSSTSTGDDNSTTIVNIKGSSSTTNSTSSSASIPSSSASLSLTNNVTGIPEGITQNSDSIGITSTPETNVADGGSHSPNTIISSTGNNSATTGISTITESNNTSTAVISSNNSSASSATSASSGNVTTNSISNAANSTSTSLSNGNSSSNSTTTVIVINPTFFSTGAPENLNSSSAAIPANPTNSSNGEPGNLNVSAGSANSPVILVNSTIISTGVPQNASSDTSTFNSTANAINSTASNLSVSSGSLTSNSTLAPQNASSGSPTSNSTTVAVNSTNVPENWNTSSGTSNSSSNPALLAANSTNSSMRVAPGTLSSNSTLISVNSTIISTGSPQNASSGTSTSNSTVIVFSPKVIPTGVPINLNSSSGTWFSNATLLAVNSTTNSHGAPENLNASPGTSASDSTANPSIPTDAPANRNASSSSNSTTTLITGSTAADVEANNSSAPGPNATLNRNQILNPSTDTSPNNNTILTGTNGPTNSSQNSGSPNSGSNSSTPTNLVSSTNSINETATFSNSTGTLDSSRVGGGPTRNNTNSSVNIGSTSTSSSNSSSDDVADNTTSAGIENGRSLIPQGGTPATATSQPKTSSGSLTESSSLNPTERSDDLLNSTISGIQNSSLNSTGILGGTAVQGSAASNVSMGTTSSNSSPPQGQAAPESISAPVDSNTQTVVGNNGTYNIAYTVSEAPDHLYYSFQETIRQNVSSGSYRVLLPDGRTEVVNYTADDSGYHPVITYEDTNNATTSK